MGVGRKGDAIILVGIGGVISEDVIIGAEREPDAMAVVGIGGVVGESVIGTAREPDANFVVGGGVIGESVIGTVREPDANFVVGIGGVFGEGVGGAGIEGDAIIVVSGSVILYLTIISTIMPVNTIMVFLNLTIPDSNIIIAIILYAIGVACTGSVQSSIVTSNNNVTSIYLNPIRQIINTRT